MYVGACQATRKQSLMILRHSSIRHSHMTEAIRNAIMKKEAELASLSKTTDTRLSSLERSLAKTRVSDVDQDDEDEEESEDRMGAIA